MTIKGLTLFKLAVICPDWHLLVQNCMICLIMVRMNHFNHFKAIKEVSFETKRCLWFKNDFNRFNRTKSLWGPLWDWYLRSCWLRADNFTWKCCGKRGLMELMRCRWLQAAEKSSDSLQQNPAGWPCCSHECNQLLLVFLPFLIYFHSFCWSLKLSQKQIGPISMRSEWQRFVHSPIRTKYLFGNKIHVQHRIRTKYLFRNKSFVLKQNLFWGPVHPSYLEVRCKT